LKIEESPILRIFALASFNIPVARKYSVLTEIIDIFTQACIFCIHDKDISETDFERTFLKNHMKNMVSIDLFTVPTATFRIFFVHHVVSSAAVVGDRGLKILRSLTNLITISAG
jgi:hypothetical protein